MLQTLYKVYDPTTGPPIEAEFYELSLKQGSANGGRGFFVREYHGWWNEAEKRPMVVVTTLEPAEGAPTYNDALDIYQKLVERRVSEGFVHSYAPQFSADDPAGFIYRKLE